MKPQHERDRGTPEIVRAVQLVETDENLLSPALRRSLTKQRKALYEEEHPETKRGSAGGRAKAGKGAKSQNATKQTLAFIDVHAKQTDRHRATIAREISEAEKIGDDVMRKIVGTSLDRQSEITALAAMDEQERQEIVDRAVAGEKVSAAKTRLKANIGSRLERSACQSNHEDADSEHPKRGDTPVNSLPFSLQIAAIMAAIPAYAVGPEQIAARKAALLREENEVIARYTAHQRDCQAREARAAQEELKREIERRWAGGR
jgi:hypothetical protein